MHLDVKGQGPPRCGVRDTKPAPWRPVRCARYPSSSGSPTPQPQLARCERSRESIRIRRVLSNFVDTRWRNHLANRDQIGVTTEACSLCYSGTADLRPPNRRGRKGPSASSFEVRARRRLRGRGPPRPRPTGPTSSGPGSTKTWWTTCMTTGASTSPRPGAGGGRQHSGPRTGRALGSGSILSCLAPLPP